MATISEAFQAAIALHQQGRLAEALRIYWQIVATDPTHAEAWHYAGVAAQQQGDFAAALESSNHALLLDPRQARYHFYVAESQAALGRLAEAEAAYGQALKLDPKFAHGHDALGVVLAKAGRLDEALDHHRQALTLEPDLLPAHLNLATALHAQGKLADAVASYRHALTLNPTMALVYNNLANALRAQGSADEAIAAYRQALAIDPNLAGTQYNLGVLLEAKGDMDEALTCYQRALAIDPRLAEAHCNLGNIFRSRSQLDKATACYRQALATNPACAEAHVNLGLAQLMAGDFANGWQECEWRWRMPEYVRRHPDRPLWDGSPLAGRKLLVTLEQGSGDLFQFARYVKILQEAGERVILHLSRSLIPFFQQSGFTNLAPADSAPPQFDVHTPLMSLPRCFQTTLETIPRNTPYLFADLALVESWRERLGRGGFKIAIAWQGNPEYPGDRFRSIPLAEFAPLAQAGAELVSLQKGLGTEQLPPVQDRLHVREFGDLLDVERGAFMDTAAVMRSVDLVVTSDTSIAHLAGGLGVPVWVALGVAADWRWMLERADTPWYPTMRLWRQTSFGDWPSVFRAMGEEIRRQVQAPG